MSESKFCRCLVVVFLLCTLSPCVGQQLKPINGRKHVGWSHRPLPNQTSQSSRTQPSQLSAPSEVPSLDAAFFLQQDEEQQGSDTRGNYDVQPSYELIDPSAQDNAQDPWHETSGRLETIIQRYPDGKPQISRQVMQDESGNYRNHGPWKLFNREGQVLAEGEFDQGRMHGNWQRWHPPNSTGLFAEAPFNQSEGPFLSTATFIDGELDGSWAISNRLQRKVFEMSYREGKRHGRAIWYYENGLPLREIDFQNGLLHGALIEYDRQNQESRRAVYDEGQELITRTSWYYKDQKRAENNFLGPQLRYVGKDDWWNAEPAILETVGEELQHGQTQEWWPNGQIRLRGQYRQGKRVGLFVWWHQNGQKQIQGLFVKGLKTGRWTWWHPNGIKAIEGNYQEGVEEGTWVWLNEAGEIDDKEDFSNRGLDIDSMESLPAIEDDDDEDSAEENGDDSDENVDT